MKKLLLIFTTLTFFQFSYAQTYEIDNVNGQTVTTCSGTFYDSGGAFGSYLDGENYTVTFCPTTGQSIVANLNTLNIASTDQLCVFNGPNTTTSPLMSCINSSSTGGVFSWAATNAQGCLSFSFSSVLNTTGITGAGWAIALSCQTTCQTVEADILSSTPVMSPPDTGYIDICVGDAVTFTGTGNYPQNNLVYAQSDATSTFEWTIEGQVFTGQTITHVFNNAGGYRAQLKVTDINGCSSFNSINQRIRVAPAPSFVGTNPSNISGCVGDTVTLFGNATSPTQNFASPLTRGDSLFLPDGNNVCYQTSLKFTDFNPNQTLTSINDLAGICVNMEHSWVGDLDISITCPNGNSVVLLPFPNSAGSINLGIPAPGFGGTAAGTGFDYCWTPTATVTWSQAQANGMTVNTSSGIALAPGNYASSQPLAGLIGCPLNGEWELEICDNLGGDNGYIFNWEIALAPNLYPNLDTFTPAITGTQWQTSTGIVTSDTATFILANTGSNDFTYTATNEYGCSFDTTITINVAEPPLKPTLSCGLTNASSITVNRNTVVGAGSYEINIDNGGWQLMTTNSFTVSNLQPLQSVFFQLRAIGQNACNAPSEIDSIICITSDCQLVTNLDSLTQVTCNGLNNGIAYFSATSNLGGILYSLNNGSAQSSGTFSNISIGNHFVIIEDANTCKDTINFTITEPTVLTSTTSETPVVCNSEANGTATVTPSGGTMPYAYLWDANANNQTTTTASNLLAGTYSVTITDANNCTAVNQVTIIEPTALALAMDKKDVNCFQESTGFAVALPSGGVGGYTYSWNTSPIQTTDTIFNLPIGNYSVTVTDANNCTINNSINLTEPNLLEINIVDTSRVTCFGTADGEALTTTTGGTIPYNYLWTTNDTTANVDTLSGGFHSVTITDANGCKDSTSVGIYEPPMIVNTFTTQQVTCFGLSDGTATVIPSGGIGSTYTYEWNNPANNQTTATASNLVGGLISVIVRDEENCPQSDEIYVLAPPLVFVDTMISTPTVCFESNEGTVSTSGFGGSGNLTYVWDNGGMDSSQVNLFGGQYTVTVSDDFGCIAIDSIIVGQPDSIEIGFTSTPLLCNGDGTGTTSISVIGGTTPYNYLWSEGNNTTTALNNLQSNTYSITVTDANNCIQIDSTFIPEPIPLTATATFVAPLCNGDANGSATIVSIGGNAGHTYSWNTSPIQTDTTAIGLTAGIYTYSVTDSNNCFYQNNITVTQPDALVLAMNATNVACRDSANGIAVATPIGGAYPFIYNWATSTLNDSILSPLDTGNYAVTVTDVFGCVASNSILITQPTYINSIVSKGDLSCFESGDGVANVVATGGVGNYNYLWSNANQTNATSIGWSAGWAVVTITDGNNCPKQDSILITQPTEVISVVSAIETNCFGDNTGKAIVNATGGVGLINYVWNTSPVQVGDTAINLYSGSYIVTATDATGCTDIDTIGVGEPTELVLSLSKTDMSCFGQPDGTATVVASGGVVASDYIYNWSNGALNSVTLNLTDIFYNVSVTDDNGCTTIDSIKIDEPVILSSTINNIASSCFEGNDGQAIVDVAGGTTDNLGNYSYQWGTTPVQTSDTAINLTGGATYIVTITDANACVLLDTVTINQPMPLALSGITTNTSCDYSNDGTGTITPIGGTAPYFYNWSVNNQITSTATGLTKGNYLTTVTDNNGCEATISVSVTGPEPILLDAVSVAALCKGDANGSLLASGIGGTPFVENAYSFEWEDGQLDSLATNLAAGTYLVTATDAVGCIGVDSFAVTEPAFELTPNAISTDISCFGERDGIIRINPTGGTPPYLFSTDNQSYSTVNNIAGLGEGTYVFFIKDKNDCFVSDTVEIVEPDLFSVFLPTDTTIVYPNEVTITPILDNGVAPFDYKWTAQDSTGICDDCIEITASTDGVRYLMVTDSNGCVSTANIYIKVEKNLAIYVATGFTPNNDGTNDYLFIQGDDELIKVNSLIIYNRWGEVVFENKETEPNNPQEGWDGLFNGQRAVPGVYGWVTEVEFSDGSIQTLKGNTTLVW
ncbi:MAG: gliding motility-associated C-terminal domain-containing protein [Saprospiraceae bacterium]